MTFRYFLLLVLATAAYSAEVEPLEIGATAPNFSLPGVDGKTYTLNDFKDAKALVVIFTANHCPTAQAYEDRMIELVNDYEDKGVAVVGISSNHPQAVRLDELGYSDLGDSFEDMKIRAKEKNFNFPYVYDGDTQTVAKAYGPQATPHVFIFDADFKLRYEGRFDDTENPYIKVKTNDVRNALDAILSGGPVPNPSTKVFGCSMKWADKVEWVQRANEEWQAKPVNVEMIDSTGITQVMQNPSEKLLLVNVWATWCGPCVVEFPELVKIYRMYSGRDFDMVTISADKPAQSQKVLEFLNEQNAAFRNYQFSSTDVYALIDAVDSKWPGALPHTVLVEPGGNILYRHTGLIDPLEVKQKIVEVLGRYYADNEQ